MECGRAKSTRPTYWTKVRNPSHPDKYALHVTPSQRTNAAALQFWSQASLNHGAATQAGTAPLSLRVCNSQLYLDVPVEEAHHRALDCYLGHANDTQPLAYSHLQASWLYESSPHVRNLTLAKHHFIRAFGGAKQNEALILLWMRVRLQARAFAEAIHYRDWTRAFP